MKCIYRAAYLSLTGKDTSALSTAFRHSCKVLVHPSLFKEAKGCLIISENSLFPPNFLDAFFNFADTLPMILNVVHVSRQKNSRWRVCSRDEVFHDVS